MYNSLRQYATMYLRVLDKSTTFYPDRFYGINKINSKQLIKAIEFPGFVVCFGYILS